jgi:hypothetical protein
VAQTGRAEVEEEEVLTPNACRGEGSVVGPLLAAARALPLPGGGRAASTVLSSALPAASYLTRITAVAIRGSGSTCVSCVGIINYRLEKLLVLCLLPSPPLPVAGVQSYAVFM